MGWERWTVAPASGPCERCCGKAADQGVRLMWLPPEPVASTLARRSAVGRPCRRPAAGRRARSDGEADLSAEYTETGQEPRLPAPHGHPGRPRHSPGPPPQGPPPPVGLSRRTVMVWRVRDRATFQTLRRSRRRARRGPITVTFAPGSPSDPPQVAYSIGRKAGGAVVRNRLRRRMRAIVAELGPALPPGAYLLGATAEATGLTFGELRVVVSEAIEAVHSEPRT